MVLESPLRLALVVVLLFAALCSGQTPTAAPALPIAAPLETLQELTARLSPTQQQSFAEASRASSEHRDADALLLFNQLLTQLPGDTTLTKFAADSALNLSDTTFVLNHLKPIAQANPDDWQAALMLTRAYAESGDKAARDTGIVHLIDLHQRGLVPPGLTQYVIEQIKVGKSTLILYNSLVPWGNYKIYNLGQLRDPSGAIPLRMTLESSDLDQLQFAREHPAEAAGRRLFSLDAYLEMGADASGQRTQQHFTYEFFTTHPTYEIVRRSFLEIATGKRQPLSSSSGLVVR